MSTGRIALVLVTLVFALGTPACSLAPLDTSGTIMAGPDGSANACPDHYVARWGRCCPADSTASTCPATLPRDTSGALYAPDGTTCPHDYELRFGRCCPADSGSECPPGEIGAPCTSNDQCRRPDGANLNLSPFCLTPTGNFATLPFQAPDGYCSVNNCNSDADCGASGTCLKYFGVNICVRSCTPGDGGVASCPGTGNHLSCMSWKPPFAAAPFHYCFPDCTMYPSNTADAGTASNDGGGSDAAVSRSVCTMDWQCYPDIHQCALPCGSVNDNLMCQLSSKANYDHCDPNARHCSY